MTNPFPDVSAPGRRHAGVCLHLSSLPGRYGIGELGASARQFVDSLVKMRLGVWQFLPLGPTAYGNSPYQALSTFAGNEMLLDVEELRAQGLLQRDELRELETLPTEFVDFGALIPVKNKLLRRAAVRFDEASDLQAEFAAFVADNDEDWLHDYALFRALKSHHDERPWPDWRADFVHREAAALAAFEQAAATEIKIIKVLQFLFFQQWLALRDYAHSNGVALFGDMPIYIALDSSDAWANRELLRVDNDGRPDFVAGVPPDYFSEDGQLWGNPLYDWSHHAETDYSWWADRLRATAAVVDLVRIDHFRAFESYWSIPADSPTARIGTWEQGPGDAFFDAMRSALGRLPVIAEDLGVITSEVEELRNRQELPGMRVLQFDICDDGFSLDWIPDNCVCYTGTHDNDTTVGWFLGSSDDNRDEHEINDLQHKVLTLTGSTAETVHIDFIKSAFATDAYLAIAPLQDFLGLGSGARLNTPGTTDNNWRWRLRSEQLTPELYEQVAAMVSAAERD